MRTEQYRTRKGVTQLRPVFSQREAEHFMIADDMEGFCLCCGETQSNVEPDAERYVCESCGMPKVYGFEQLMLLGIAVIA